MEEQWEDTSFDALKQSAETQVSFSDEKVTLYTTDSCVLGFEFHDPSQCHQRTTWKCLPDPEKCYLDLHNKQLSKQLRTLKEKVDTGHRHLMTMNGPLVFVFEHYTDDDARQMVAENPDIKKTFLLFLQEIDSEVKSIKMEIAVGMATKDVTQAAGQYTLPEMTDKCEGNESSFGTGTQRAHGRSAGWDSVIGLTGSGKAVKSCVAGTQNAEKLNQGGIHFHGDVFNNINVEGKIETEWNCDSPPLKKMRLELVRESYLRLVTMLKDITDAELKRVSSGSLIFYFAHSTRENAIDMIIRYKEVKAVILQFLRDLDRDIEDIRIKVELRELGEPQEQAAQDSSVKDVSSEPIDVDSPVCKTVRIGQSSGYHGPVSEARCRRYGIGMMASSVPIGMMASSVPIGYHGPVSEARCRRYGIGYHGPVSEARCRRCGIEMPFHMDHFGMPLHWDDFVTTNPRSY